MTIAWKENEPAIQISSLDELLKQVDQLAKGSRHDQGIGAYIEKESGEGLSVVVAGDKRWLLWTPTNYSETGLGSHHSISASAGQSDGDSTLAKTALIPFSCFGHYGEFSSSDSVSEGECRDAISEFYLNEGLPEAVRWQAD